MTDKKTTGTSSLARLEGILTLDLVAIEEGAKVRLRDGETAEVVENPRDGMWILLRILEAPDDPAREGGEELVFWADVLGVLQ
ncbi:MAG: hypothetical protein ACOY17_01570 [Pseudomonadota bacterium]|jgi:hypothetical protein|nr:hypothetical protein [Alphaproteobacteria bacterium]